MLIDVLISSCARPDMLEISVKSFREHVTTEEHTLRFVLIEDRVGTDERRKESISWIIENHSLFHELVILEEKAGVGYWWQKAIEQCESEIHIHLEDDNKFMQKINIDPLIEILLKTDNIIEIIFSRGLVKHENNPRIIKIYNTIFTENDLMSIASGIFKSSLVYKLLAEVGWANKVMEHGTLTPATKKLGYRKLVLGENSKHNVHYIHMGEELGLRKGAWIK